MTLEQVWEARVYTTSMAVLAGTEVFVSLAHDTWELAADAAELHEEQRSSDAWSIVE